jgi:hypothetical protein
MEEKELNIRVNINTKFNIEANPNIKDWNEATIESKNYYVRKKVREYLLYQIDEIIDELMDGSKIKFLLINTKK